MLEMDVIEQDAHLVSFGRIRRRADAGVTRLYSEDMQHGTDINGVKIINPFKV